MRLLLNYASFVNRARGDVEGAFIIYRKAYRIDETNPKVLAHFAHFLAEEGGDLMNSPSKNKGNAINSFSNIEAERLFSLALKSNPNDALIALWYAKLLRKVGKIGQAELMYKVAYDICKRFSSSNESRPILPNICNSTENKGPMERSKKIGDKSLRIEAACLCNYATFIFRQRKDLQRAKELFVTGLRKFPMHKGLLKNFGGFLNVNIEYIREVDPACLVEFRTLLK
jgi:Tfp pilus assembly protein PilF